MTIMYIFFNLWISTSFGISAGIWAITKHDFEDDLY
jgi:hypothetical protein